MKHPLLIFIAALVSLPAASAPPTGQFGHGYTSKQNDVVWTVRKSSSTYELVTHGDESVAAAHPLTLEERKAFWKKMWWQSDSFSKASCLGNHSELLCHVPARSRKSDADLKGMQSDFFHYDPVGGVIEAKRIAP